MKAETRSSGVNPLLHGRFSVRREGRYRVSQIFPVKDELAGDGQSCGLLTKPTGTLGMDGLFFDGGMGGEHTNVAIRGGLVRRKGIREEATSTPISRFKKRT